MSAKSLISNFLRQSGLIFFTDKLRYYIHKIQYRLKNEEFLKQHPEIIIPPDYLIYESFRLDYKKYFEGGRDSAEWLLKLIAKYQPKENIVILDWGCGPGRIIRHMPQLLSKDSEIHGTDYNSNSIKWCAENLKGISFNHNSIEAELPYKDDHFDVIYGLSILTHLSEQKHNDWVNEFKRIIKKDGVLLLSTQGDNYLPKLLPKERELYNAGKLVIRSKVLEGHRTYSAFHPNDFMNKLFKDWEVLDQVILKPSGPNSFPQDIWVVRKK